MVQAYNFMASWQLFPERGNYPKGDRPKSGTYRVEAKEHTLQFEHHWVSIENQAFHSTYMVNARSGRHAFEDATIATSVEVIFENGIAFTVLFYQDDACILELKHEILPNGYLKVSRYDRSVPEQIICTEDIYHKQMSVLPYAASVSGAVIKPTEEGVIRHKALTAMEEQTNMQLDQIRKQIELLALQAQEIHQRKELSSKIYTAKLSFSPVIGQLYYLYQKTDESFILSMVSPKEWGSSAGPFKSFIAAVKLLADHTWMEVV